MNRHQRRREAKLMHTGVEKKEKQEVEAEVEAVRDKINPVDQDTPSPVDHPALDRILGRPGQVDNGGFEDTAGKEQVPERERRRWPASEASRMVVEAAAEAANLEQERQQRAEKSRQARIRWAMNEDDLPKIGDDFLGANLVGDEWVEVFRSDLANQQQRQQ